MSNVLVLGLGNPILTDDGVGVKVALAVSRALPPDADVEIEEVSIGGLTLMERMLGYRRVVLIDAMMLGTQPVGTILRMSADELASMVEAKHTWSPHDANLLHALELASRMGLDIPEEIVLIGVEVENVLEFGEQPTPAVEAAIPAAVMAVMTELERWQVASPPAGEAEH